VERSSSCVASAVECLNKRACDSQEIFRRGYRAESRSKAKAEQKLSVSAGDQQCGPKPRIMRYSTAKLGKVVLHVAPAWYPIVSPP
jgi:hypothetical protein